MRLSLESTPNRPTPWTPSCVSWWRLPMRLLLMEVKKKSISLRVKTGRKKIKKMYCIKFIWLGLFCLWSFSILWFGLIKSARSEWGYLKKHWVKSLKTIKYCDDVMQDSTRPPCVAVRQVSTLGWVAQRLAKPSAEIQRSFWATAWQAVNMPCSPTDSPTALTLLVCAC